MPIHWPAKDPSQLADYDLDWFGQLNAGDTIASYICTLPGATSLSIVSSSFSGTLTKATLSGGLVGMTYLLQHVVTTVAGGTFDATTELLIKSK